MTKYHIYHKEGIIQSIEVLCPKCGKWNKIKNIDHTTITCKFCKKNFHEDTEKDIFISP